MDYNATTPPEPEVIEAITEALQEAWGNPSSNYIAGEIHLHPASKSHYPDILTRVGNTEPVFFTSVCSLKHFFVPFPPAYGVSGLCQHAFA